MISHRRGVNQINGRVGCLQDMTTVRPLAKDAW
jgi:hypothetical protein